MLSQDRLPQECRLLLLLPYHHPLKQAPCGALNTPSGLKALRKNTHPYTFPCFVPSEAAAPGTSGDPGCRGAEADAQRVSGSAFAPLL